jgi:hypothetical protein
MAQLPSEFHDAYEKKGHTFFAIAEIVLSNHGRQLTADDIAAQVDPEREGVRQHLKQLEEDGWIDGADGPKRYTWDTQHYNPAEYEASEAVDSVAAEALALGARAWRSVPEFFALVAIIGLVAGAVLVAGGVVALVLPIGAVPPTVYALIGGGFALGSLLTLGLVEIAARMSRRQD